jgi:aryl-alcohol dehydrogenase-like predicted oxidoreductase
MKNTVLGDGGPRVSALGLGCMGMSTAYGERNEAESIATIHEALDLGVDLLDSSDAYGNGHNESLLGKALAGRRDQAFLITKFGNIRLPDGKGAVDGSPEYVAKACDVSLERLGTDHIDLYFQHRVDADVPIEETVGAMARLIEAGKVRYIGLSEAGPETLRRAHATHPITALQTEYSLWTRDAEAELLPLCRELGVGYVAYSPLGRGFLSGTIRAADDLIESDRRHDHPRFKPENLSHNVGLLDPLGAIAEERGCSAANVALAWVLGRGEDIVPIPGTKQRRLLRENLKSLDLVLSDAEKARLEAVFAPGVASGERYPPGQLKRLGL